MEKIRIGLVGTGFAGKYHLECLSRIYGFDVDVAGVTSKTKESREKFGKLNGIKVYDDAVDMLGHVDIVDICSPPYAHEELIYNAAKAGKGIICEKPLTGFFGCEETDCVRSDKSGNSKIAASEMLGVVVSKLKKIQDAVNESGVFFGYAENFVYAPSVQKEREIIEKTFSQILRMTGEESHSGSASPVYGIWKYSGGGSLIGKGVHPLSGMLYLKRIEGIVRTGKPIRPASVSARTHELTRLSGYDDKGYIRTDYEDVEDYGFMHITFQDGTVADVLTSEVVLGGIYDYIEVFANNHRTRCAISPVNLANTYNPCDDQYQDIYTVEKCSTKEGWSAVAPDENYTIGYQPEMQDFIESFAGKKKPQSGLELAIDTTATVYAAYLSAENNGSEFEIPLDF